MAPALLLHDRSVVQKGLRVVLADRTAIGYRLTVGVEQRLPLEAPVLLVLVIDIQTRNAGGFGQRFSGELLHLSQLSLGGLTTLTGIREPVIEAVLLLGLDPEPREVLIDLDLAGDLNSTEGSEHLEDVELQHRTVGGLILLTADGEFTAEFSDDLHEEHVKNGSFHNTWCFKIDEYFRRGTAPR